MGRDSKQELGTEEAQRFGLDTIEEVMRERVRATIEAIVEEELEAALGAGRGARVGEQRQGYRHGVRARRLTRSTCAPLPSSLRSTTTCRYHHLPTRRDHKMSTFLSCGLYFMYFGSAVQIESVAIVPGNISCTMYKQVITHE